MQRTHEILNLSTSGCRISCVFGITCNFAKGEFSEIPEEGFTHNNEYIH